jgi:3-oxoacyl-[acyl-carrier-protein] synthase-3
LPIETSPAPPVRLLALGAYVPARVMTNADWAASADTSDEWIRSRTGIERRHFAAAGETTAGMAAAAARSALAEAGLAPAALDEIIVATDTPEMRAPDTAAFVQHLLGARQIPTYDLSGSGCAGFLQGLDIARSRVRTGTGTVMVIGVELFSRSIDRRDRSTAVLFGDAAAAALVGIGPARGEAGHPNSTENARRPAGYEGLGSAADPQAAALPSAEILRVVSGTDGSRADILGLPAGGTRHPFTLEMAREGRHLAVTMNGREVFRQAVRRMSAAATEVLRQAGLTTADLTLLVAHQANLRILQAVGRDLALPDEKVFVNVQEYGNTGSASVPLALWEARRAGRIRPGDLVVLTSFGAGFHWAAVLLRF